jgi:uncharacterized protein (DUF736 family)
VHDLFHVLGLSENAPVSEVRQACARRIARTHPDFRPVAVSVSDVGAASLARDAAVDFIDVSNLVPHMQARFFGTRP